jgi:nucleoside-diphosphate-sugar epimerase
LQTRDFVNAEDVAHATIQASQYEGIFDIGTGKPTSINGLAKILAEITGNKNLPVYNLGDGGIQESQAKPPNWFKPRYTLEMGLQEMFYWFKEQIDEDSGVDSSV